MYGWRKSNRWTQEKLRRRKEYEKYKEIKITKNGLARAKYIERRHELFRKFLKDIVKTDEGLVESETEKLAHCISCHTAAKLEKFIEQYMESNY